MQAWGPNHCENDYQRTEENDFTFAALEVMRTWRYCNILNMLQERAFAARACRRMMTWFAYLISAGARYLQYLQGMAQGVDAGNGSWLEN